MRAGGVGRSLDGVEVRRVAAGSCLCSESPTLTAYLGWTSTRERGRPARTLFLQTACHPRLLPCKAHQTRLYGVLFPRAGVCAGETPALPGGLCAGETPALPGGLLCERYARAPPGVFVPRNARAPGGSFFTSRNASIARMVRETNRPTRWRSNRVRAGGVGRSLDGVEVRRVAAGSCLCSVGHPPGARASRPHPIPANSLPSKATPLQGAPNPPLRGSLPSCREVFVRARRPRSRGVFLHEP